MRGMFLLFSHKLDKNQITYAQKNYKIDKFIYLPKELQSIWSNFDPDLKIIDLEPFKKFLKNKAKSGDVVLVQGDFGASFAMVQFALMCDLVPVYATTKRIAKEYLNEDGKMVKKSIFEFRRFREYE